MHTRSRRHGISLVIPVLSVVALVAACCSSTSVAAVTNTPKKSKTSKTKPHLFIGPLSGKWTGQYGGAFSGTFKLHWTQSGSRLTGSITLSNPGGTYRIHGSVHGNTIGFGAVGVGATYTGTVSGKSMSGHYKTPRGGGTWGARQTS